MTWLINEITVALLLPDQYEKNNNMIVSSAVYVKTKA